MWRHKSLPGNEDSDQSISDDDEEQDFAWPENFVSLAGTSDRKKEGLGVVSQLELLKGVHQVFQEGKQPYMRFACFVIKSLGLPAGTRQKDVGFSSEDEVEMPDFQDKSHLVSTNNIGRKSSRRDSSTCEVDERISGDEGSKMVSNSAIAGVTVSETLDLYTRGKGKPLEMCTGSAVDKDARRLVHLGEKVRCSAHHPLYTKGGRRATKTRPTSHVQPHRKGAFWPSDHICEDVGSATDDELLDEPEALGYGPMDKSASEILGESDDKKLSESRLALPVEAVIQHDHSRYSMVELLDDLRGKNRNLHLKSRMVSRRKGRNAQRAVIKSVSSSGKPVESDEEPCEIMNSGSSTDNEEKVQNLEVAVVEPRRKTITDKFQEAFGSASVDERRPFTGPKQSSTGLFGRLQQVMQWQKEQDTEFLKKLQTEVCPKGEARCIDVKILSRSFDAKLTVCHCSLLENEESSLENPRQENFGKKWTIIFNSRVCGDVDLEVANFVRIHPPWKEIQVQRGGEIIILATYFSQIYA